MLTHPRTPPTTPRPLFSARHHGDCGWVDRLQHDAVTVCVGRWLPRPPNTPHGAKHTKQRPAGHRRRFARPHNFAAPPPRPSLVWSPDVTIPFTDQGRHQIRDSKLLESKGKVWLDSHKKHIATDIVRFPRRPRRPAEKARAPLTPLPRPPSLPFSARSRKSAS